MSDQFDVVNKAKHYNGHPSGIEAKHILRCLNFNMGSALKYVMRRHGKEYDRSLKSAAFYLRDQEENQPKAVVDKKVHMLLVQYQRHEIDPLVSEFYARVNSYLLTPQAEMMEDIIRVVEEIRIHGR